MHLQENALFDFWPWHWGQGHMTHFPGTSTSYDLATCKVWICHVQQFRRCICKQKILFDLWPWNVAQYPLHYVTYAHTKFEVATSDGLEEYTFTRNPQHYKWTHRWTTNFGTKLIYPIFLRKSGYDSLWNHEINNSGEPFRLVGPPVSYSIFFLLNQKQINLLLKKPTDQEQHYRYKSVIQLLHHWNDYKYTS